MLSINKKKYLKSLNIKKNRLSENKILIEGLRIIEEAMNAKIKFDHIWLSQKYDNGTHKISDFICESLGPGTHFAKTKSFVSDASQRSRRSARRKMIVWTPPHLFHSPKSLNIQKIMSLMKALRAVRRAG